MPAVVGCPAALVLPQPVAVPAARNTDPVSVSARAPGNDKTRERSNATMDSKTSFTFDVPWDRLQQVALNCCTGAEYSAVNYTYSRSDASPAAGVAAFSVR